MPHEEDPDADEQNQREPGNKYGKPGELFFFRFGIDGNLFLQQFLRQISVGIRLIGMKLLAVLTVEFPGNIVPLNNHRSDFSRVDLSHEVTEVQLFSSCARLVEHVEKQDHHQADNQPEREILVKLVQSKPPSKNVYLVSLKIS